LHFHFWTIRTTKRLQNGSRDAKLLLALVNFWDQARSQCFSATAVWAPLTLS
jgi:hypothetical protein